MATRRPLQPQMPQEQLNPEERELAEVSNALAKTINDFEIRARQLNTEREHFQELAEKISVMQQRLQTRKQLEEEKAKNEEKAKP